MGRLANLGPCVRFSVVMFCGWWPTRRTISVLASVVLHLVFLALIYPWVAARPPGADGSSQGAGADVALVSAASLGLAAPHAPPMNAMATTAAPQPPVASRAEKQTAEGAAKPAPATNDEPPSPASTSSPQTVAWAATGTARLAATPDDEQRGARETAGGDPTATSQLLNQIARCLPPQMRPRLPAHMLVLKIADNGALSAAPMIDSLVPLLSAEDRSEADKVVQAALQCGPYAKPTVAGQVISLAVDFSTVSPLALPARERR